MREVHTGAYVSLLAPGKTDYTACRPRKTTTCILHVVPITTHTHDRCKSIKRRKKKKDKGKERRQKSEKKKKKRSSRTDHLTAPRVPGVLLYVLLHCCTAVCSKGLLVGGWVEGALRRPW